MKNFINKRVLLVTGKGGVGRTTLSAALAISAARAGKKVLLTEIGDPEGDYTPLGRLFDRDTLPNTPVQIDDGLKGCSIYARKGHESFLESVIPVRALVKAAMRSGALRRFFDSAPSLNEMGMMYRLITLYEETEPDGSPTHDLIIVDMPATGHTLAITKLPDVLLKLMPVGPIADVLKRGREFFYDPEQCSAVIVTLPETLPVTECLELIDGLEETHFGVAAVMVNKVSEDVFSPEETGVLKNLMETHSVFGQVRFNSLDQTKSALRRLNDHTNVPIVTVGEYSDMGRSLMEHISRTFDDMGVS